MRILMTMNVPYTRFEGGANRSNRHLLEGLAARGHRVAVVTPALAAPSSITHDQWRADLARRGVAVAADGAADRLVLNGVEVTAVREQRDMRAELRRVATDFQPDWILVASEDPSQTLLAAALDLAPQRVAYMALTPQLYPFGPEALYPGAERAELVRRCALVLCLCDIVASYIETHLGRPAAVYQPPHFGSGPFPVHDAFDGGAALLMNAGTVKGLPIVAGLARALPHRRFAAIPGYTTTPADRELLASLPNMELWGNEPDLDAIFARTAVLLMPSLWMESFGMAVVDAMLRGIPTLAADHGALPAAKLGTRYLLPVSPIVRYLDRLGPNMLPVPVVPEQDIAPWRSALEGLLSDRGLYADPPPCAPRRWPISTRCRSSRSSGCWPRRWPGRTVRPGRRKRFRRRRLPPPIPRRRR